MGPDRMGPEQPESEAGSGSGSSAPSGASAPPFAMARSVAALVGLVVGVALVTVAVLLALEATEQIAPALGGAAVALVAGIVALIPLHWAHRRPAATAPMLAMAGSGLRALVTLLGALVLIAVVGLTMPAAAMWTLGWYLLVMVFEAKLIIRYFRLLSPPPADSGDDRQ